MEKLLHRFTYIWQAEVVAEQLKQFGIKSRVVEKPRDYVAIYTGQIEERMELLVSEADERRAKEILNEFFARNAATEHEPEAEPLLHSKNHFKRAVIFSFLGVFILPVVFNVAATWSFFALVKEKGFGLASQFAFLVLAAGWFGSIALLKQLVSFF